VHTTPLSLIAGSSDVLASLPTNKCDTGGTVGGLIGSGGDGSKSSDSKPSAN